MHRIDHPTAVAERPAPLAPGTPGYFTGGDPLKGQDATWMTHDWANDVQENIVGVIEAAQIALAKGDGSQLLFAIRTLAVQNGIPLGVPVPFIGVQANIPAGFVPVMGQTVQRASYPTLTSFALNSGVIVEDASWLTQPLHRTKFSMGDGASTIRLPDLRSEVIYGADLGRGVRSAAIGDWLDGDLKPHTHNASTDSQGAHVHGASTDGQGSHNHGGQTGNVGDHQHDYQVPPPATDQDSQGAADGPSWLDLTQYSTKQTAAAGAHDHPIAADGVHVHNVTVNSAGDHVHNVTVASAGGTETRQRGTGYTYIMRVQ